MSLTRTVGFCVLLHCAVVGALGCGGDDGEDKTTGESPATGDPMGMSGQNTLKLFPTTAHTGYDGEHEFKVELRVASVKAEKWESSDSEAVQFTTTEKGVLITTKKAGEFTITARAGDQYGSAKLVVTQYSPADWTFGKERYNNGIDAVRAADGGVLMLPPPGAMPDPNFDPRSIVLDQNAACTYCHGDTSILRIRHTPLQIAGYSDAQVIDIFTMGTKPPGAGMNLFPANIWKMIHQWKMSEQEKQGILVYLRSLEPRERVPVAAPGLDAGVP